MKYTVFGRVLPERAAVVFTPQAWRSTEGDVIAVSCDAAQLHVTAAELAEGLGHVDAFLRAEHVSQAVVSALGFALGSGYSVELVQVVGEDGESHVFGVRPGNLHFERSDMFSLATELAKKDALFRLALRDYVRAITETLDCAHYCYRAIEAIKSAFEVGTTDGWRKMHDALATTRDEIETTVKSFADPVRHGNWTAFKGTTSDDRNKMLVLTRDILARYLDFKSRLSDENAPGGEGKVLQPERKKPGDASP